MFGKKKTEEQKSLSPQDALAQQIEGLTDNQALRFIFPESWGGDLGVIELNPKFPEKGKKYILSVEKLANGKPSGQKTLIGDSEKTKDLAKWIIQRSGKPYTAPEEAKA